MSTGAPDLTKSLDDLLPFHVALQKVLHVLHVLLPVLVLVSLPVVDGRPQVSPVCAATVRLRPVHGPPGSRAQFAAERAAPETHNSGTVNLLRNIITRACERTRHVFQ